MFIAVSGEMNGVNAEMLADESKKFYEILISDDVVRGINSKELGLPTEKLLAILLDHEAIHVLLWEARVRNTQAHEMVATTMDMLNGLTDEIMFDDDGQLSKYGQSSTIYYEKFLRRNKYGSNEKPGYYKKYPAELKRKKLINNLLNHEAIKDTVDFDKMYWLFV